MICPNPRGEQAYLNLTQPVQSLYPDDIYGVQNPNYVLTNAVIGDNSQSLDQDMGYEDQVDGYDLDQEDEVQIHFIIDPFSSFDLNNYAMIESDDESDWYEPEEELNNFKINVGD